MRILRLIAISLAALCPQFAASEVLYKSVDANGVVMFSDSPPPSDSRILEQRTIPTSSGNFSPAALAAPVPGEQLLGNDPAIARANSQFDEAERALALARRDVWSARDGLRLTGSRMTPATGVRVEQQWKSLKIARQALMALLHERGLALNQ